MKKQKVNRAVKKSDTGTVVIDRTELIKQLRRTSIRRPKTIQPKKGHYDRKDKSWKKDIQ